MTASASPVAQAGYAICGEPRSGSNFLCQALESTNLLGHPRDWLNVTGMRAKGDKDYPADTASQIEAILDRGCGANRIYGFKLFSVRFDDIKGSGWTERLPGLRFIHLDRRDLLGQAISDWRAAQTGAYRSTAAGGGSERYDRGEIAVRMKRIAHGQSRWRRWFARNGIAPLELVYEDVVADPQAAAEAVARLMSVAGPVRVNPDRIAVGRQSDALSAEWRDRFVREEGELAWLDDDSWPRLAAGLRRLRRRLLRRPL